MANGTTIDNLQIEIKASANSAEQSLDALKETLQKLSTAFRDGSAASYTAGIQKVADASNKATKSTESILKNLKSAVLSLKVIPETIASFIDKSNTYIEDVNLFNASLGKYAKQAQKYADEVGNLMGIDPAKWMRNQGIFQTLTTGFGVTGERAIVMSQNLTQLGYDLSSFFNIAVEGQGGAMQKLQAAISGELEPIRRLGYDLSDARLSAIALSLGIKQSTESMNQAQKAQLRYYALMTQVTTAQGDMARTLNAPANQLRILKAQLEQAARAIGNIFIPALNKILPIAIAVVEAVGRIAQAIANLFGFKLPDVDYSGIQSAADVSGDLDDNLESAGGSAKKLNELLADWDELNIIQSESGGGGSGASSLMNADEWAWELPEYDFLAGYVGNSIDAVKDKIEPFVSWVEDHIEEIVSVAEGVGAALLLWKLADGFVPGLSVADSLLSNIGQVAGALAVSAITITLNIEFMSKFLENDDYGALAGAAGTSIIGSTVAGKMVENMLKGKPNAESIGHFTSGALLTITGVTDMQMTLSEIATEGFTRPNMIGLLTSAGITGVGLFQVLKSLTKWLGLSGSTAKTGGAAAILTVGLGVSMYLDQKAASIEGLDSGKDIATWMGEKAGSALSSALAGYSAGQLIDPKNKKLGMTFAGVSITLSSAVSLVTNLSEDPVENNLTPEDIEKKLWDAVADSVKAGAGIGLTVGAETGPVAGLIAGAATSIVLTVAAVAKLEADKAIAIVNNNLRVIWGKEGLTKAEVGEYLNTQFDFSAITAHINSIQLSIDNRTALKTSISNNNMTFENEMLLIDAGIDEETSFKNIKAVLVGEDGSAGSGTLIGDLNEYIRESTKGLELFFSITGVTSEMGDDLESIYALDDTLSNELNWAGNEYAQMFRDGLEEGLDELEADVKERALALLNYISEISYAIAEGERKAKQEQAVNKLLLTDLTPESANAVITEYAGMKTSYADTLMAENDKAIVELSGKIAGYEKMIEDYERIHGEIAPQQFYDELDAAKTTLDELKSHGAGWAEEETARAFAEYDDLFMDWIIGSIVDKTNLDQVVLGDATSKGYSTLRERLDRVTGGMKTPSSQREVDAYLDQEGNLYTGTSYKYLQTILDEETLAVLSENVPGFVDAFNDALMSKYTSETWWYSNLPEISMSDVANDLSPMVAANGGDLYQLLYGLDYPASISTLDSMFNALVRVKGLLKEGDVEGAYEEFSGFVEQFDALKTDLAENYDINIDTEPAITAIDSLKNDMLSAFGAKYTMTISARIVNVPSFLSGIPAPIRVSGFYADGGFPDTGELFVARERGAELVGSIGNRTAVANNEQIEYGISMGVRDANAEQNELLRQQNQYLKIIAAKSGRAVLEPSTELARTVKRAEEMRLRNEGV